jgi:hypothetical protein
MADFSQFSWKDWRSGVPSQQTIVEQTMQAPDKLTGSMAQSTFDSARLVTGIAWGSVEKRNDALPASAADVASFDQMGGLFDGLTVGAFDGLGAAAISCVNGDGSCADDIFDAQMAAIINVWESVATDMPVIGWIVQGIAFGVMVGQMIWMEAQDPPDPTAPPLTLDQGADQDAGERIMNAASSEDWTPLWLPPHDGHGETYLQSINVEYSTNFVGERLWLGGLDGQESGGGEGLMPGQATAAQQWQTRLEQASTGSTRLDALANWLGIPIAHASGDASTIGKTTTYGIDYFRPAMSQLNQIMWAEVSKVGGEAMFRVNCDRMEEAWDGYWGRWQQLMNHYANEGTKQQAQVIWNILQGGMALPAEWSEALRPRMTGLKAQGSGDIGIIPERYRILQWAGMRIVGFEDVYLGSKEVIGYDCMPCTIPIYRLEFGNGMQWSVTNAGKTRWVLDNLRERQIYALRTLMVAYLTGTEPGLGGKGSALFNEWEKNRNELLASPWRNSVEMDRVPKVDHTGTSDWRNLLVEKRIGGLKIALAMAPAPALHKPINVWGQGDFPTKFNTPPPTKFAVPEGLPGSGLGLGLADKGEGGGAGALILLGAAGVAAFLASRRS